MTTLPDRLRARKMLAMKGPMGIGIVNAVLAWMTAHADPDCAEAADTIAALTAERDQLRQYLDAAMAARKGEA